MTTTATGWVALAGQIVGTAESWETVYTWDHRYYATKAAAVRAGFPLADGTDDFNVGEVRNGRLVWFGWMDTKHPDADYAEVAAQFGWTAP